MTERVVNPQTECGFCVNGLVHDPLCQIKGLHMCPPVECPYCHPEGG